MVRKETTEPKLLMLVAGDNGFLSDPRTYLEMSGYDVTVVKDGMTGLRVLQKTRFDICLFDVEVSDRSAVRVTAKMRELGISTPIMLITSPENEELVVEGLEVGANDYTVKPVSPFELLMRISLMLKINAPEKFRFDSGSIVLNEHRLECWVEGTPIKLTPREFRILQQLINNPFEVMDRSSLISAIYGNDNAIVPKAIDVHVHNIRNKLGNHLSEAIHAVRGVGYKYVPTPRNGA